MGIVCSRRLQAMKDSIPASSSDAIETTTIATTRSNHGLPTPSESPPPWKQIASQKQAQIAAQLKAYSLNYLRTEVPDLPPIDQKDVRHWALDRQQLDAKTIEITESTPSQILGSVQTRVWSAEDVMKAFIQRAIIAQYLTNPMSEMFFDEAMSQARALDKHLNDTGTTVGPLHGLPISIKDVMNVKGHPTTVGYVGLADDCPEESDELITRLQDAGAILYCKTNVPQGLMSGECANYLFGRTTSPDNRTLSAGGSSGGEGSLVALGGSPLGIGTDIAGSIRTPANFNGVYGLCPSFGRLPCHSARYTKPSYINAVAGPLSRSIDGLEVYMKAVLGTSPSTWDATCVPMPWNDSALQEINASAASKTLTFGLIPTDGLVRPHPPIERGMRQTREALVAAGYQVIDLPTFFTGEENLEETLMRVINHDGGVGPNSLLSRLPEPAHPETVFPSPSDGLSAAQFVENGKTLLKLRKHFMDKLSATASLTTTGRPVDVLILPSGGHVAPPHGTMDYYLYEAISNILDWTCATIPVGRVDPVLDPKPGPEADFEPMSQWDQKNWDKYSPEAYENGAICLQILGQRFTEEKVIACLKVVAEAVAKHQPGS